MGHEAGKWRVRGTGDKGRKVGRRNGASRGAGPHLEHC